MPDGRRRSRPRSPPRSRRNAVVAARSTPAIARRAQARAFWTSASSSPISSPDQPETVAGDLGIAAAPMVDVRHRGDRAADEPPLPARRAVDELLELGPAVRLVQDPLADGWARLSTVIQSPASRDARRRSCQARSASSSMSRSSSPNANQRSSSVSSRRSRSATNSQSDVRSRRVASRNPRFTASMSGQRTPWSAPIPGAMRRWPSRYGRIGEVVEPGAEHPRERLRIAELRRDPATEGLGVGPAIGHEGVRLRGDRAEGRRRAHDAAPTAAEGVAAASASASRRTSRNR